ncbi:MAG TPA: cytochrome c peroxidase [Ferruginibacter sp.]|nr:cytochrome c peroxidase [Ferruginibacter sp.]
MKTRVIILFCIVVIFSTLLIGACKKNDVAAENFGTYNPTYLSFKIPAGWPIPPIDIFADNPLTEQGFQLGKKLFYDGRLSKDGNFPCGSCHQQFAAFVTYDHDFSHGFNNAFTTRNAPALFNLAWMPKLHWDGGINHLEVQPLAPITAPNEMAETIDNVLNKLKADTAYPRMFYAAYGNADITSQRMLKALAQFMGTIVSNNSKYDKVKRGEATFTAAEESGYNIFKAKCETCHKEPLFTDNSFRNNGLAVNSFLKDYGRMRITNDKNDSLKFKVPSLRNVMLTFPYMHDGRLYSLGQVIDHYRFGIITSQPTLDPLLINRIAITNAEKNDLLYFLNTLTDSDMTNNPRFSEN